MAQQTAVEWLVEKLYEQGHFYYVQQTELIDQAKQIEKEQIKKSWFDSTLQFDNAASMVYKKEFEQYYNETYGKADSSTLVS